MAEAAEQTCIRDPPIEIISCESDIDRYLPLGAVLSEDLSWPITRRVLVSGKLKSLKFQDSWSFVAVSLIQRVSRVSRRSWMQCRMLT